MFRAMTIARADPSRHYLKGVRIEPIDGGGVWMIATNGSIMLIQRDREGHAEHSATLAVTAPKVETFQNDDGTWKGHYHWIGGEIAVAALKPGETVAALTMWESGPSGPHVLVERLEDRFPDWRKAIGSPVTRDRRGRKIDLKRDAVGGFMTRTVDPLIKDCHSFQLHGNLEDLSQMLVTYVDDPDRLGVLMKSTLTTCKCQPDDMLTAIGRGDLVAANEAAQ